VEVQILEKTDTNMRFVIRGVDVPFANALRRVMLAEVPSMAIAEVVIIQNSSVLNDEVLAHRLGLIPLRTDLDSYNLPEECTCKSEFGCNLCRVALTLEAEADGKTVTIYSGSMVSENPDVVPVTSRLPLVKLAPHQKIRLEAYARLGKGKTHAKWQPVSVSAYKYLPQIRIDAENCDACAECVKVCPQNILVKSGKSIEIRNEIECTLCQDCVEACVKDPMAIEITWDKSAFIFNLESSGALPVERILIEGLNILDKKFEIFQEQLGEMK
jgi:DNA-directed RNA polymerase subunit D